MPDSTLCAAWVDFYRNDAPTEECEYHVVYVNHHPEGPYVLVHTTGKEGQDFNEMIQLISGIVNGKPQRLPNYRTPGLCEVIRLAECPTQEDIAKHAYALGKHVADLSIPHAYFRDVPVAAYNKHNKLREVSSRAP